MSLGDQSTPEPAINPYQAPAAAPEQGSTRFAVADFLILTAVIAAACAVWAYSPGWGVIATFLLAPVAVRSLLVFRRRAALGIQTSPTKKAAMVAASIFVAVLIYLGLIVSVCVAFAIGCFSVIATAGVPGPSPGPLPYVLLFGAPIAGLVAGVGMAFSWIRRRWRRDTCQADPSQPAAAPTPPDGGGRAGRSPRDRR